MNVIIAYLDAMFSAYPQTPRLLEAKAELQQMMDDAYTSLIAEGHSDNEAVGQVIRDFGNLEELAPVLGITSDLTPQTAPAAPVAAAARYAPLSMDEARGYGDALHAIRFRLSTAIALFVLSPAAIISLPVAASSGILPITEGVGVFIGLLILLVLVAIGVVVIVATSRETAPYDHISEGRFALNPAVTRWANALAAEHERARIRALQIAVALWILAPIPLIAFALLLDDSVWTILGVVLVLVFVASGLAVLLPHTWANTLAEEVGAGAGSPTDDGERSIVSVIAAFYWPLLTAIFLAWSFIGNAWGISWVVWPVGAVLFGAIAAGGSAVETYRGARR